MLFELENTILNDVLCFLYTSRDALTNEEAVSISVGFYKSEEIKEAKSIICQICKEKNISRRSSRDTPNPIVSDTQDILDIITKMEGKNFLFPNFVAKNYTSMPPQSGFLAFARIMSSLRDEVSSLRTEITQLKESRQIDMKSFEDISDVKQDIADIKVILNSSNMNKPQILSNVNHDKKSESNHMSYAEAFQSMRGPFTNSKSNEWNFPSTIPKTVTNQQNGVSFSGQPPRGMRPPSRRTNIVGTCEPVDEDDGFSGVPRTLDVFVGGCKLESTEEKVVAYCKRKRNFSQLKCSEVEIKSENRKAFKVTVEAQDRDLLLVPDFWPKGIYVKKFFNRSNKRQSSNSDSEL